MRNHLHEYSAEELEIMGRRIQRLIDKLQSSAKSRRLRIQLREVRHIEYIKKYR